LAREVGVKSLTCKIDSKLTVGHLNDEFQIRDPTLLQYYHLVRTVIQSTFNQVRIQHIPRSENIRADILSKLASTKLKNRHRSLLQQMLFAPSITNTCHNLTQHQADNWTTPYTQYLQTGNPPPNADRTWITKAARYTMIGDDLYKRRYDQPLLKCVTTEQAQYIIKELHEGICGPFSKWGMDILGPFSKWGMDILGPFSPGKGQVKFLIVVVDYFTKWIEAKPLTTITAQQVQQFVWKDIICRYGVPHTIITDNGRQFIDIGLAKFYIGLGIKHITSSVEHPQTNGQAEAANKVILVELRKRLDSAKG